MHAVVPASTFFDYMCASPLRFDRLLRSLKVSNTGEDRSASPFFTPAAFPSASAEAAVTTAAYAVNPFAEQLTRNGGLVNGGQVVSLVLAAPSEPERLESAEQTLAMAKMLHDLATAESEAQAGNRLSVRPAAARSKEFSKVYLATSKQLLENQAVAFR